MQEKDTQPRSPEQRATDRRIDRAYNLIAKSRWTEADTLFDEILRDEPDNADAATGKRLIARKTGVDSLVGKLDERACRKSSAKVYREEKASVRRLILCIVLVLAIVCAALAVIIAFDLVPLDFLQDPRADAVVQAIHTARDFVFKK